MSDEERAAVVIRASQGDDAKESLSYQREAVPELACELVDAGESEVTEYGEGGKVEVLDLGIHTGFSTFERSPEEYGRELLDENEDVQQLIDDLEAGEFAFLVSQDMERISRDDFFSFFKRAVRDGGAEFAFTDEEVDNVDSLPADLIRTIERRQKLKEIRKAKKAIRRRISAGKWHGRPPFGFETDDDGDFLVEKEGEFETAELVIEMRDSGSTYSEVREKTGVSDGTIRNIMENRERYE